MPKPINIELPTRAIENKILKQALDMDNKLLKAQLLLGDLWFTREYLSGWGSTGVNFLVTTNGTHCDQHLDCLLFPGTTGFVGLWYPSLHDDLPVLEIQEA